MKTLTGIVVVLVVSLSPAASLSAQPSKAENASAEQTREGVVVQGTLDRQQDDQLPGSFVELDGLPLMTESGKRIGVMKGVEADSQTGRIHFFTFVRQDGNGGEKTGALPYGAFKIEKDRAVLTVSPDKLGTAPAQASASDKSYMIDLQQHYGLAPAWEGDNSPAAEGSE